MRRYNKDSKLIMTILFLIGLLAVGYATLGANLRINGVANVPALGWDVHFKTGSITPTNGSVIIDTTNNEQAATITNATQVSYAVTLALPGDFYEFTVQVENTGNIDAMIDSISSKLGNTEITTGTLPSYLDYSVTYSDGTAIAAKQILAANGGVETIKVRLEFKEDVAANQLPGEAATLNLNFQINYVQRDSTAVAVPHPVTMYGVYSMMSTHLTINNTVPDNATLYDNAVDALAYWTSSNGMNQSTQRPFYFKHIIQNNIVKESYVEFVITPAMAQANSGLTAGTYTLKGGIGESSVFLQNAKTMYDAFGGVGCTGDSNLPSTYDSSYNPTPSNTFRCEISALSSYATSTGEVKAYANDWDCTVDSGGDSYCDVS